MIVGPILGGAIGATSLWIGFHENNQGEFFDSATGKVDWAYAAEIFSMNALAVWLITLVVIGIVLAVLHLTRRNENLR